MGQSRNEKKYFNLYKVVKKNSHEQIVEGNTWFFYSKYIIGLVGVILAITNQALLAAITFVILAIIMFLFYRGSGETMLDLNTQTNSHVKSVDKKGKQYSFSNPVTYIIKYK